VPLLYLAMLWPGRLSIFDMFFGTWYYPQMMTESGQLSVWFLMLTLAVTPILLVINVTGRATGVGVWMLRRRRHFGLVSFAYAAVHLVHYIRYKGGASPIIAELTDLEILVGWAAFAIFLALAVTSNRASTRKLGTSWKALHRLVYLAAGLSFLHWYLFDFFTERVLFWALILTAIKLAHAALRPLSSYIRSRGLPLWTGPKQVSK